MEISIKVDHARFNAKNSTLVKQIAFATSKAINETTKEARAALISHLSHTQKGGKKWWNSRDKGIIREFAKKTNLVGAVLTKMYFAQWQEKGGPRRSKSGKDMTVPSPAVPKSKRRPGGAKAMLAQKTVFATKDGRIYRRVGGKKSRQVKLLFTNKAVVQIDDPMLHLKEICHKVYVRRFKKNMDAAMAAAIRTAK